MYFKGNIWEFTARHPRWISPGMVGLQSFDAVSEKILLSRRLSINKNWRTLLGGELTVSLLESSFKGGNLFSNDCYLQVLHAEKISSGVGEYLLNNPLVIKTGCLILAFGKDSTLFKKLAKKYPDNFFKIESPKFWQADKLLNFFCKELQIALPLSIKNYLMDSLPMNSMGYITALNRIKLYFSNPRDVDIAEIREIITPCKLDQFSLANFFVQRKINSFLQVVLRAEFDFDSLAFLFSFMQRHLLRLLDPSYINKKKHPSNYDREIARYAKLWQPEELRRGMRLFGELEIAAKKRNKFLISRLRVLRTGVLFNF
ncbi:MAG: hypothetical protein OXB84_08850 [Halobacteriovoraceae bacterium]|nr:hypothetical protein [Halobacteriovoraceae bacterium]